MPCSMELENLKPDLESNFQQESWEGPELQAVYLGSLQNITIARAGENEQLKLATNSSFPDTHEWQKMRFCA